MTALAELRYRLAFPRWLLAAARYRLWFALDRRLPTYRTGRRFVRALHDRAEARTDIMEAR